MKKLITLLLLIITFAGTVKAQETFTAETSIGVRAGANFSTFSFEPTIEQKMMVGYTGGIALKHFAHPKLGFQMELNLVQRGWTEELSADTSSYTRTLNYLELPFMTQAAFGSDKTKFLINLGPNVSYLLSEKKTAQPDLEDKDLGYYREKIEYPVMVGLSVGLGMLKNTPLGNFQVEARFTQNLTNAFKSEQTNAASRNQSLAVTASYFLPLKRKEKTTAE
ncbi:PorT family protein [Rufibacter immobilis]|uniref:PorT family protein n=1 Tax=Rufibacter immobilis TaxID=1348778 RepID=A0A3M9N5Z8_9BACT|nr:porin family protein [Rufibacter immobilis]RNI32623.1 PorT family protein [Rufibacter immobilis]